MSSAASDEETEELVAALNDDAELRDSAHDYDSEDEGKDERGQEEDEDDDADDVHSELASPRRRLVSDETEDEDDDLHIAARAGIRLLEENMHFREEVLRLREQLEHVKDEKTAMEQSLADREAQNAALSNHLREAILENQSVLSELSQAKDLQRASQHQIALLEQQLQQLQQQRSPRRRTSFQSPTATGATDADGACISPTKPTHTNLTNDDSTESDAVERRLSYGEVGTSPRRRPTLARLREIEAKYDEEHQKCSSLKLELNFTQRRVSELKPLQGQLEHVRHELEVAHSRLAELEAQLTQSQKERQEERELIQSLRQTVLVYEQLNDPRHRTASGDHAHHPLARGEPCVRQEGGATTAETVADENHSGGNNNNVVDPHDHNQQLERLERAAEMIDGRFNLRDENERLLQQLQELTDQVLELSSTTKDDTPVESEAASSATERRGSMTTQRYLEQHVAVLQQLLRRFRLEWQHAHDARVCLEDEKTELLKQLERQRTTLQRVRSASVTSVGSRDEKQHISPTSPVAQASAVSTSFQTAEADHGPETGPERPNHNDGEEEEEDDDTSDEAHARRLWERTNAICEALLRPSPTSSREEEVENELLCFALLRRLVDSWTTDKPKRMQLHDWLTNAIRGTGVRKPLYLHELSSEIAMGFQTLMVPILREKFGIQVHVEKRLRNVIVTDLRIQVRPAEDNDPETTTAATARVQRVYHSLLSVIDGENGGSQNGDEYQDWLGNCLVRRASRGYLGKA